MRNDQSSSLGLFRLAALAVGARLRRRGRALAACFRPGAAGLSRWPSRLLSLGRWVRHPAVSLPLVLVVLPFVVLMSQTSPRGPLLPLGANADRFFMGLLADDSSYLAPGEDFLVGRCSDGRVARQSDAQCAGFEPIASASALFADAVAAYRGDALSALPPARADAARELSASMRNTRWVACIGGAALFSEAIAAALLFCVGALFFALGGLRKIPALAPAVQPIEARLFHGTPLQPGNPPAQAGLSFRLLVLLMGGAIFALGAGSAVGSAALIGAQKLAPNTFLGEAAASWLLGHSAADSKGVAMGLPESSPSPWHEPSFDQIRPEASLKRIGVDFVGLGVWTSGELLSKAAPRLLAERAPSLAPPQRARALAALRGLRQSSFDLLDVCFPAGFTLFFSVVMFGAVFSLLFMFARSQLQKGRQTLVALAEEGARLPFASHERDLLLGEAERSSRASQAPGAQQALPRKEPPRL
jgi:hypothetical protein